jgi:predicted component of type VI protein secretion system
MNDLLPSSTLAFNIVSIVGTALGVGFGLWKSVIQPAREELAHLRQARLVERLNEHEIELTENRKFREKSFQQRADDIVRVSTMIIEMTKEQHKYDDDARERIHEHISELERRVNDRIDKALREVAKTAAETAFTAGVQAGGKGGS